MLESDIGGVPVEDPSLMQIDGDLLTADQITALQEEFKQVASNLNVEIQDSVPQTEVPKVSIEIKERDILANRRPV
jgi:hypothetical protein